MSNKQNDNMQDDIQQSTNSTVNKARQVQDASKKYNNYKNKRNESSKSSKSTKGNDGASSLNKANSAGGEAAEQATKKATKDTGNKLAQKAVEETAKKGVETAAQAATGAAAGAATGGVATAAQKAVEAAKALTKDGGANSTVATVAIVAMIVIFVILLPLILIIVILSFLFVLFSNLISNDAGKENAAVAEKSLTYKMARDIAGFDIKEIIPTDSSGTYITTYDAKIKAQLYEDEDVTDVSDGAEEMRDSSTFGEPIRGYASKNQRDSNVVTIFKSDVLVQGYNGQNSMDGDYLKIVVRMDENDPLIEKLNIQKADKDFLSDKNIEALDGDSEVKKIPVYLYIPKNNVHHIKVSDHEYQFTVEDEYMLMGTSLKIIIQNKYNGEKQKVNNKVNSYLKDARYNKYEIDSQNSDASVEDTPIVLESYSNKGKDATSGSLIIDSYKLDKDNISVDPGGSEFNVTRSMANVSDYGNNGDIISQDVAEILASYAVSKKEQPPEEGYFSKLDADFIPFIAGQFNASFGSVEGESYVTNPVTGEKEVDTNGNNIELRRVQKFVTKQEKNTLVLDDDAYAYVLNLNESIYESEADKENALKEATHRKVMNQKRVKEGETYDYAFMNNDVSQRIAYVQRGVGSGTGDYKIFYSGEAFNNFIEEHKITDAYNERYGDIHNEFVRHLTTFFKRGKIFELSEEQLGSFKYTEYYLDNATIPPFNLSSLITKMFTDKSTHIKDDNKVFEGFDMSGKYGSSFDEIMAADYYKKELYYVYDMNDGFWDGIGNFLSQFAGGESSKIEDLPNLVRITKLTSAQSAADVWSGNRDKNSVVGKSIENKERDGTTVGDVGTTDTYYTGVKFTDDEKNTLYANFLKKLQENKIDKFKAQAPNAEKAFKSPSRNADNSLDKSKIYTLSELEQMSPASLEEMIQNGYDMEFTVEGACPLYGSATTSSCGASPKNEKKWFFFSVGYKQDYYDSFEPLTQMIEVPDENGHPIRKESNYTYKERIAYYKNNILEYLDNGVFGIGGSGNADIVAIARAEEGNVGGLKFQLWYLNRTSMSQGEFWEWCAIFVSWAANELGYIDANLFPKSASVAEYVRWYRDPNNPGSYHDKNSGYTPKIGDLAIIDWDNNGTNDHIEIVSEVHGSDVYTIGGNTLGGAVMTDPGYPAGRVVAEHTYVMNPYISGYASPAYPDTSDYTNVIYDVAVYGKDYGVNPQERNVGILGWSKVGVKTLFDKIYAANPEAYNGVLTKHSDSAQRLFEGSVMTGDFFSKSTSSIAPIANEILNSTHGKAVQDTWAKEIVNTNINALEAYKNSNKLKGRAFAYFVDMLSEITAGGHVAMNVTGVQALIDDASAVDGTLASAHTQVSGGKHNILKNVPNTYRFSDRRTGTYNRLNAMQDGLFEKEISGTEVVEAMYLRGVDQDAVLCAFTDPLRAETRKTYMGYDKITATGSRQWSLQHNTIQGIKATTDSTTGIRMFNGRYMIAMAPTYGKVGTRLDITVGGKVIKVILGDIKSEGATCQHHDGSLIEFVVDEALISSEVKKHGSFNALPQFKGPITKIVYRGTVSVPTNWGN